MRNVGLREEHRERAQCRIGHRIHRLATRAHIGKSLDYRAEVLDEAAERVGAHIEAKREAHRRREFACSFPWSYTASLRGCLAPFLATIIVCIENCCSGTAALEFWQGHL